MNSDLLTVKQFAEAVGITQQAVYKQLNNKLNKYVVVVEGRKMLKISALEGFENNQVDKRFNNQVDNKFNNQVETILNQNQQIIDMLQKELNEKNQQIAELQRIIDQQQKLSLVAQQRVLELEEKLKEPEAQQEQEPKKKRFLFW